MLSLRFTGRVNYEKQELVITAPKAQTKVRDNMSFEAVSARAI